MYQVKWGERERVEDSQVEGFSSRILLNEIIFFENYM